MRDLLGMVPPAVDRFLVSPIEYVVLHTLATPIFLVAVAVILALQWAIPAKPRQKTWSVALVNDFVWALMDAVLQSVLIVSYVRVLESIYHAHLGFLTLEAVREWPLWLRFAWGIVLLDFLRWLQHVIQHKVSWFWEFHAVHHSQPELNLFTDFRAHVFEYLVRHAVYTFPLLMLSVDRPRIVAVSLLLRAHACLYHSNIRTNFGPLRYVLVNPQSHRIHHSIEPRHRDRNFGALFSIWDHLFGTQHRDYDEYPDTGIPDRAFPLEENRRGLALLTSPLAQLLYPFRVTGARLWGWRRSAATPAGLAIAAIALFPFTTGCEPDVRAASAC